MIRSLRGVLLVSALLMGTVGTGSAAASPCYSSTANSTTYTDALGDGDSGLAPDITSGSINLDSACNLTVDYSISGQAGMLSDDFLAWFIDSDDNLSTGSQAGFEGADFAVGRLGTGSSSLHKYNPATGSFEAYKAGAPSGQFGVRTLLSDYEALPGTTFRVAGAASWDGLYDSYYDWAPEIGAAPIPFTAQFSGQAPPPPPPPPAAPVPTPTPPASPPAEDGAACRVPLLRGLTLRQARGRLRTAGCRLGTVTRIRSRTYAGRVVRSRPRRGTRLAQGATVNLVMGKSPRRRRKAGADADLAAATRMLDRLAATK